MKTILSVLLVVLVLLTVGVGGLVQATEPVLVYAVVDYCQPLIGIPEVPLEQAAADIVEAAQQAGYAAAVYWWPENVWTCDGVHYQIGLKVEVYAPESAALSIDLILGSLHPERYANTRIWPVNSQPTQTLVQ